MEDGLEGANTLYTGKAEDNLMMELVEKKVKKLKERKLQERIYRVSSTRLP